MNQLSGMQICFSVHIRDLRMYFLVVQMVKILPARWETQFDSWVRKIPWRREWQRTLVFLPGEFHGLRSLAGYSPWGHERVGTTE